MPHRKYSIIGLPMRYKLGEYEARDLQKSDPVRDCSSMMFIFNQYLYYNNVRKELN